MNQLNFNCDKCGVKFKESGGDLVPPAIGLFVGLALGYFVGFFILVISATTPIGG
jgi:hypothetical protein